MSAIPTDIKIEPARERSRLNEILVVALAAAALLLGLCLVSYHPNDPSWNAAGESSAQNWIGAVGANVAAALFQTIGLAAYLVPVLILAAAWRRFRAQRINTPIYQLLGLVIVVFSACGVVESGASCGRCSTRVSTQAVWQA
jgi:S-DNA-T family DNA segregation ATPase FtsK/SpoIIIE